MNVTKTLIVSIFLVFGACQTEHKPQQVAHTSYTEPLIDANKRILQKENERIEAYWKRREWNMQQTKTGLWLEIYEHGTGKKVAAEKFVTLNYTTHLLDGTLCYSSEKDGQKKFKVGTGNVEAGLEEAVLLLKTGDKARIIIPYYQAYGLIGDEKRIPAKASLVYDIEVVEVSHF